MSYSRTTTRQASLVPHGSFDPANIHKARDSIDSRLAAPASFGGQYVEDPYSYDDSDALPSGSPSTSPTLPSGFDPRISENSSLISRSTTNPVNSQHRPQLNNVISWTSNATRRTEYEKIDRAQQGARGLVRRVWPQCMRRKDQRKAFFTGECDGDSVRRFRMDVGDEDSDDGDDEIRRQMDDDAFDEKHALEHEYAGRTDILPEREVPRGKDQKTTKAKKPWWSCFDL